MSIINKILREAVLLSENRERIKITPVRTGNHERNPKIFLERMGIERMEDSSNPLRQFHQYLGQGMDGGFLGDLIAEAELVNVSRDRGHILIELSDDFVSSSINELTSFDERVQHVFGALLTALKERRFVRGDVNFEAQLIDKAAGRYRLFLVSGSKDKNDNN